MTSLLAITDIVITEPSIKMIGRDIRVITICFFFSFLSFFGFFTGSILYRRCCDLLRLSRALLISTFLYKKGSLLQSPYWNCYKLCILRLLYYIPHRLLSRGCNLYCFCQNILLLQYTWSFCQFPLAFLGRFWRSRTSKFSY